MNPQNKKLKKKLINLYNNIIKIFNEVIKKYIY